MKGILVNLLVLVISFSAGKLVCRYQLERKIFYIEKRADKNANLIKVFYLWIKCKQSKKNISFFLENKNFYNIAIYGMHFLGECLYDELKKTGITVSYGIDKNLNNIISDLKIVSPDDKLEKVDAIIVTPVFNFNEIERHLSPKVTCPIISIEDILKNI